MVKKFPVHFGTGKGHKFFIAFNTEQGRIIAHVFKYKRKPVTQKGRKTYIETPSRQVGPGRYAFSLGYGVQNRKEGFTPVKHRKTPAGFNEPG
jgi:hypothetical protein